MSEHGTWPAIVANATGWRVDSNARSGQTSTEIALRDGALAMTLTLNGTMCGRGIGVTPLHPTTSFRESIAEPMADIEIVGSLAGARGTLRHSVTSAALDGWAFTPDALDTPEALDGSDLPAPGASSTFVPESRPTPPDSVAIIWCGRNNIGSDALRDIEAMTTRLTALDTEARFLVLGIVNSELEPRGTAVHAAILALNAHLAQRYADRFVDVRTPLVGADEMAADIPPSSRRLDIIHLNEEGDRVVAAAVLDRLRALGWWSGRTTETPR